MKILFFVGAFIILTGSASGVIDPDNDMMGLYFDSEADIVCVEGLEYTDVVDMYLILTRPTAEFIYGFEAGYDMVGEAHILSTQIPDSCLPPGGPDNMIIGFSYPHPTSITNILATITVMYFDLENHPVEFYLHGTTPSSLDPAFPTLLLADGVLLGVGISAQNGPTAQINGWCNVVDTAEVSFDKIKTIYRQ